MLQKLSVCFDAYEVNTGRQTELDIAKGFSIIFMVLVHVHMCFSDWSSSFLNMLLSGILGGPCGAPVFMFCMGVGIQYSRSNQPLDCFKRGCHIFLIGILLNFLRYYIPSFFVKLLTATPIHLYDFYNLIIVDILHFAGLFFILISFFKKINLSHLSLGILALLLSICGQLLNEIPCQNAYLSLVANLLWRSNSNSYFPLFNWFIFPAAGYLFGFWLKRCHDKQLFYRTIFPVTFPLSVLFVIYFIAGHRNTARLYYGIGTVDALFVLSLIFTIISIWYFVPMSRRFIQFMSWLSKHVNSLYCTHWIIALYLQYIICCFIPNYYIPNPMIIPAGLIVLAMSCSAVILFQKFRNYCKNRPQKAML